MLVQCLLLCVSAIGEGPKWLRSNSGKDKAVTNYVTHETRLKSSPK